MAMNATVSDSSIARFHRAVGLVNLALAFICLATPAISSQASVAMVLLLAVCLLGGAAMMFSLARHLDPRPNGVFVTLRQFGALVLPTA